MPQLGKDPATGEWLVLADDKSVVSRHPDKESALAAFRVVGTKPRGTCPHPRTEWKFDVLRPPLVETVWRTRWDGGGIGSSTIRDRGSYRWRERCVTCGKDTGRTRPHGEPDRVVIQFVKTTPSESANPATTTSPTRTSPEES